MRCLRLSDKPQSMRSKTWTVTGRNGRIAMDGSQSKMHETGRRQLPDAGHVHGICTFVIRTSYGCANPLSVCVLST